MSKENCTGCLFADITAVTMILFDTTNDDNRICEHPSSPMFDRYVNDNKSCTFYTDEVEHFETKKI